MIYELPSITFFAVLLDVVSRRFFGRPLMERAFVFPFIGVLGLVLTVTTVGSPARNVYGFGFSGFSALVLAVVAGVLARRAPRTAVLALVIIAAWDVHLYWSRNLFDYVIDVWVVFIAWGWCLVACARWMAKRFRILHGGAG